jgi:hypothetical protein
MDRKKLFLKKYLRRKSMKITGILDKGREGPNGAAVSAIPERAVAR